VLPFVPRRELGDKRVYITAFSFTLLLVTNRAWHLAIAMPASTISFQHLASTGVALKMRIFWGFVGHRRTFQDISVLFYGAAGQFTDEIGMRQSKPERHARRNLKPYQMGSGFLGKNKRLNHGEGRNSDAIKKTAKATRYRGRVAGVRPGEF